MSAAAPSRPATHVLEAVLERLTYVNEETEYTVARVATGRGSDLLTVVGALLGARLGESLRLHGWWSSHAQYGRQVFRQAADSRVVSNAHRINAGRPPVQHGMNDVFLFPCKDTETVAALTVDVACARIAKRFGLDPRRDVQVLAPMHRGPAGAGALNVLLQQELTPAREGLPERRVGGRVFRIGDKVTQIGNNYDKGLAGVFNGTVGVVTALNPVTEAM